MPPEDRRPPAPRTLRFAAALAPPLAVGLGLRLWNLDAQLLGGDELHPLRILFTLPLPALLTTYHPTDVSLPLMGLFRVLADAGVGLSEWHFRAPSLLSGALLLAAAPWMLRRPLGDRAAVVLAWLLALSPLLLFYSRIARSYAPMVLLCFLAACCFESGWKSRRFGGLAGWAAAGAFAIYLHPGAGPFVVAPLGYALLDGWRGRAEPRAWLRLAGAALLLLLLCALFLVPAAPSLRLLMAFQDALQSRLEVAPDVSAAGPLSGSRSATVIAAFWLISLRGLVHLWRRPGGFGPCSAAVVFGGVAGIVVLTAGAQPRYVMAALPFVLAWLACGLAAPLPRAPRWTGAAAGAAFVLLLFLTGPLSDPSLWRGSFMHRSPVAGLPRPVPDPDAPLPAVYARLCRGGTLVEAPWIASWNASRAFRLAQQQHGCRVRVATPLPWLEDPRLDLRNVVRFDAEAILASGAEAVILHLDLDAEERALSRDLMPLADPMQGEDTRRRRTQKLAIRMRQRFGPPEHADARIVAWDLERVRRASAGSSDSPAAVD